MFQIVGIIVFALSLSTLNEVQAAKWPKYTDEEMFAKADFIVVGKIDEQLTKTEDGLHRAKLKVDKTLLAEQGGSVKSMVVAYNGPDSSKHIGVGTGVEGVWLLRRSMSGTSVIHPQQFRPSEEEEQIARKLKAWLPAAFDQELSRVQRLRAGDPDGKTTESLGATIQMFRRSEQLRVFPGIDGEIRERDWIERLQKMLALYERKMDFPVEAKAEDDKQILVKRVSKVIGREPEPGTPLYDRVAAQAPGILAHIYAGFIKQTVAADDARFSSSVERIQEDVPDIAKDALNNRVSALQHLVDLANANELP